MLFTPINNVAYASLEPHEAQQAAGLINLSRQLGGSFGIAVLANYVAKHRDFHQADLVSNLSAGNVLTDARVQALTRGFIGRGMNAFDAKNAALQALNGQVLQQSSMLSFNDAWLFVLLVFVLVSPSILLLRRPGAHAEMPADAH
jgi:MFS transporter, DHA2 family, multidrug resistance protein